MPVPLYVMAGRVFSQHRVLTAMATVYDPSHSMDPTITFSSGSKLCHFHTVQGIKRRGNPDDRIWLYGDKPDSVYHSLLTTGDNVVVVDAAGAQFRGTRGYHVPGRVPGDEGLTYDFLAMVSVAEWFDNYFDFTR